MARRLGEVLIENGDLSPRDLAEALRSQRIFGGTLGTHLLQLGFIEESELVGALAKMHDVPKATRGMLQDALPSAKGLLSNEFCQKHLALPFGFMGEDLCLALRNPSDSDVVREAAFMSGRSIKSYIALESVLRDVMPTDAKKNEDSDLSASTAQDASPIDNAAHRQQVAALNTQDLEIPVDLVAGLKHAGEGIEQAEEVDEQTALQAASMQFADADEDEQPQPFEPITTDDAAADVTPDPTLAETVSEFEPADDKPSDSRIDTDEIPAETTQAVAEAPVEVDSDAHDPILADSDLRQIDAAPHQPQPCARLAEIGRLLANARDRDAVLNVALAAVNALMPRAAIFVIRNNEATLWKSDGMTTRGAVTLPLTKASVLSAVHEGASFAYGPIANTPTNAELFEQLGGERPNVALVLPVDVRGRPVVALYGDSSSADTPSPDFSRLGRLAGLITMALEAVILRSKILRESGAIATQADQEQPEPTHTQTHASSVARPS